MHRNADIYQTSDLGLAAALLTFGSILLDINKENPRRAVFEFSVSVELEDIIALYWNGELKVSALRLNENTKLLKSRIYGG